MDINLAIAVFKKEGKKIKRKLYFSTNLEQTATDVVRYYRSRFQIEFLYRDEKQHYLNTDRDARHPNRAHVIPTQDGSRHYECNYME